MANPAITLSVAGDTKQLYRDIENIVRKQYTLNFDTKGQPLGRITGQVTEFTKSMDAANARVVAFGASAAAIGLIEKSFRGMIDSAIEVQKSLKDIQVVLGASDESLAKFGKNLFDVAKNTGQGFQTAAEAATEFSRQGLGLEETLKRTNEALILSRLSGMGAAESVKTLTAAVNSFANQSVTATQIVNKFANVDAAFAVSSQDLAEGLSRVGASASQSGVSIDELIALITSAQQVTARGGAVIGNSFKTIFTRLERGKTKDLLESLGVSTTDSEGKVKSTIDLLKDLARVYGTLSSGQQADVAEKVGGVFQINILKAALGDLSKQYSIYNGALNISKNSTDEAIQRNEQLNQTYAAQLNALKLNATQFAAGAGEKLFGPSMKTVVGGANSLFESLNNADSESVGAKLGNGILSGLGQILSGPGLALIGGILVKLLGDFSKFATGSMKELLGLNNASKEQKAIQQSIEQILQKNPELMKLMTSETVNSAKAAQAFLTILKEQTLQIEKQSALTSSLSKQLYTGGVRIGPGGTPIVKKAGGYVPNFNKEDEERMEASRYGYTAGRVYDRTLYDGQGGSFVATVNGAERITDFKNSSGHKATLVEPPNGFAAAGYVPNFAEIRKQINANAEILVPEHDFYLKTFSTGNKEKKGNNQIQVNDIVARGYKTGQAQPSPALSEMVKDNAFKTIVDYVKILSPLGQGLDKDSLDKAFQSEKTGGVRGAYGALQGFIGSAFEVAITKSLGYLAEKSNQNTQGDFDIRGGSGIANLQKLFGLTTNKGDFKVSASPGNLVSFADKVIKEAGGAPFLLGESGEKNSGRKGSAAKKIPIPSNVPSTLRGRAVGYIPNFADALHESIAREIGAGAPKSGVYVKQYSDLSNSNNPLGLGVFNTRDEGSVSSEKRAMRKRGYARGYIPNFAEGEGGAFSAVATELSSLALMLSVSRNDVKAAYTEELNTRRANSVQNKLQNDKELIDLKSQYAQNRTLLKGAEAEKAASIKTATTEERVVRDKQIGMIKLEGDKLASSISQTTRKILSSPASGGDKAASALSAVADKIALVATALPILTSTITEGMDKTTKEGRGRAAAVSGVGDIGSFAGTGFMVGKGTGAAIGAAIGGFVALDKYLREVNSVFPEFASRAEKASESLTNFQGSSSRVLQLIEKLSSTRDTQGGALNTKEQNDLRSQIAKEASSLPPEIIGKLTAGGYDLNESSQILQDAGGKLIEAAEQQKSNTKYAQLADKAVPQGFVEQYGKFLYGDLFGKQKEEQGMRGLGKEMFASALQKSQANGQSIEDFMRELRSKSASTDAGALIQYGLDPGIAKNLNENNTSPQAAFEQMYVMANQLRVSNAKSVEEAKKFNTEFGAVIKALSEYKTKINEFISSIKIQASIVPAEQKFGFDFAQGRNEARTSFVRDLGLSEMATNMSIRDDYSNTVGRANFESQNIISQSALDILTRDIEKMVPSGMPSSGVSFESGKKDLISQIEKLTNMGKTDEAGVLGGVLKSLEVISKVPTKGVETAFNKNTQLIDKDAVIKAFKQSEGFVQQFKGGDSEKKAIEDLDKSIDTANSKLIDAQQQLAIKAAAQIDQLIKIQLEQLNKIGGGIEKVLSDKSASSAGAAVENAQAAYARQLANPQSTNQQKGREALLFGKSINELMGGVPVIGENSEIFKDTQKGTAQGLKDAFDIATKAIQKTPGGAEQVVKIDQKLMDLTGQKNRDAALNEVAKYQAMKALNLDTRDSEMGKGLYRQQLSSVEKRMGETTEGKAMFEAYKTASNISDDPAAIATYTLKQSLETLIGNTNRILQERLGQQNGSINMSNPVAAINTQPAAGFKYNYEQAPAGAEQSPVVQHDHTFTVGVNLANASTMMDTGDLNVRLESAVNTAVGPILQDFYQKMSKIEQEVKTGKPAPPVSSNSRQPDVARPENTNPSTSSSTTMLGSAYIAPTYSSIKEASRQQEADRKAGVPVLELGAM